MKILARIISYIFNPLLFFLVMPYLVVYKHSLSNFYALKWEIFSLLFVFSAVFLLFLGKRQKIISDYDLSKKEERSRFYFIICTLAFLYLFVALFFKGIFFPLSLMSLGIFAGVIIFMSVNRYVKASIHMAVTCAFIITVNAMFVSRGWYALLLAVPLVAWSRIYLKRHTFIEVVVGSVLGSAVSIITFLLAKWIYKL